jgi:cell division transport system ATP-binding protein
MITLDHVSKKFGQVNALDDVSLEINAGEFVFITGLSGSGKTTLLRLLTKNILPDKGQILVNGTSINKLKNLQLPKLRRNIGVVFQDFKLLKDQTVFENVALAMKVAGQSRKQISKRVREILRLVGLDDKSNDFPLQLAGGELQRVCLARAVINKPPILLADEPTGNLDPTTSWQIMDLIKKIHKQGTTVVMATHNIDIVNSMNERMIQLENGHIIKDEQNGNYQIN